MRLFLLSTLMITFLYQGNFPAQEHSIRVDSSDVQIRIPDESVLEKYFNDPDYFYDKEIDESKNIFERFIDWVNNQLNALRRGDAYNTTIDVLIIILIIIGVFMVVTAFVKVRTRNIYDNRKRSSFTAEEVELQNLDVSDYKNLIDSALRDEDYRLAVRFSFIKMLNHLNNKGLIILSKNKTNYDYLIELNELKIRDNFRKVLNGFEWIWYGELEINKNDFNAYKSELNKIYTETGVLV